MSKCIYNYIEGWQPKSKKSKIFGLEFYIYIYIYIYIPRSTFGTDLALPEHRKYLGLITKEKSTCPLKSNCDCGKTPQPEQLKLDMHLSGNFGRTTFWLRALDIYIGLVYTLTLLSFQANIFRRLKRWLCIYIVTTQGEAMKTFLSKWKRKNRSLRIGANRILAIGKMFFPLNCMPEFAPHYRMAVPQYEG